MIVGIIKINSKASIT